MKNFTLIVLTAIIFSTSGLKAKDEGNYRTVPFQITLLPPIGTNGIYAGRTVNRFSVNIIAGYAYGLKGLEFGGFANINRDFLTGVQFAGFINITGGQANALQFSGFANINGKDTKGMQFAGFTNINTGSTDGAQFSGFANINSREIQGLQSAGFLNLSGGDSKAVQIAGFGNFAHNIRGVQVAGFSNISYGNVKGAQISGFLNVARTVSGLQLGVFNIADTVKKGIPVGFLSIVRNGFREFEAGVSEGLNTYASFKIGVTHFYNIFSVGMQTLGDHFRWGFGYGIGSQLADHDGIQANLELMSYHINEGGWFTDTYNDLQQAKLTVAKSVGSNISVFAGPTLNLMISDNYRAGHPRAGSGFPPYTIFNDWSGRTNLKYWIGFVAGIRIH